MSNSVPVLDQLNTDSEKHKYKAETLLNDNYVCNKILLHVITEILVIPMHLRQKEKVT